MRNTELQAMEDDMCSDLCETSLTSVSFISVKAFNSEASRALSYEIIAAERDWKKLTTRARRCQFSSATGGPLDLRSTPYASSWKSDDEAHSQPSEG